LRKEDKAYESDKHLIDAFRDGDMNAFRKIVDKYQFMVGKVANGMLNNSMDAEDVGQETFIRFYRSIDQFKGDSSLGTYLTRITINLSLNEIKKRKRQQWLSYEDKLITSQASVDVASRSEARELVNKALIQLDPDFRSVVVLRMMQGFTTKETAEILQLPVGTVLSRLSRAQLKLRGILKKLGLSGLHE
jgi:RNA polymerase sigma-70 factor (ECF subfamily)